MSRIAAHLIFNPYFLKFLKKDYCRIFPHVEYPQKYLIPMLEALKEQPQKADVVMKKYIASFQPFAARLKARDETIFAEDKCEMAHSLEIWRIWNLPHVTKEVKHQLFNYLIGGYLICEMLLRVPQVMIDEIERLIASQYANALRREFDKNTFRDSAELILDRVSDEEIKEVINYVLEFIGSEATPVYAILDEKFHPIMHQITTMSKSEQGRQFVLERLAPLISDVKSRMGEGKLSELEAKLAAEEARLASGSSGPPVMTETEIKAERKRVLAHVLDAITEMVGRNQDLFVGMTKNPLEAMTALLARNINPIVTHATQRRQPTEEEKKRARDALDAKLFRAPTGETKTLPPGPSATMPDYHVSPMLFSPLSTSAVSSSTTATTTPVGPTTDFLPHTDHAEYIPPEAGSVPSWGGHDAGYMPYHPTPSAQSSFD